MHERASVAVSPSGGAAISVQAASASIRASVRALWDPMRDHMPSPVASASDDRTTAAPQRRALTYTEMMNSGTQQPAGSPPKRWSRRAATANLHP